MLQAYLAQKTSGNGGINVGTMQDHSSRSLSIVSDEMITPLQLHTDIHVVGSERRYGTTYFDANKNTNTNFKLQMPKLDLVGCRHHGKHQFGI